VKEEKMKLRKYEKDKAKEKGKHSWVDVNRTRDSCHPCHICHPSHIISYHHITSQSIHTDTAQNYLARLMSPSALWNIILTECILFLRAAFLKIFKYTNMQIWNIQIW
jgi:hypothetical protein